MLPITLPLYLRKPCFLLLISLFVVLCIVPFVRETFAVTKNSVSSGDFAPSNIHHVRRDERHGGRETDSEEQTVLTSNHSSKDKDENSNKATPDERSSNSTDPIPETPPPSTTLVKAGKSHRDKPDLGEFMRKTEHDVKTKDSSLPVTGYTCKATSECEICDFSDLKEPECQETGYREAVECIPDDTLNNNSTETAPAIVVKFRSCALAKSQETRRFLTFQVVNAICAIASTFAVIYRRRELNAHQDAMLNRRINNV